MQARTITFGVLCCAGLLMALGFLSMGHDLLAERAELPVPTPYLTEFGFAPLIMGLKAGPTTTPTLPSPTQTPYATTTTEGTPLPSPTPGGTATPSPTSGVPTSVATATVTQTPMASPTTIIDPLRVLDNHTQWIDDLGRINIRGEVENTSSAPLIAIRVETNFHNKKGRVIHKVDALTMLNHLGPGEKTCFALSIDPPSKWQSYSFADVSFQPDPAPITGLQIAGVTSLPDELLGWYIVSGQMTNASSNRYDLLRLVGTVYDASGSVIGCDFAYTFNSELAPNQSDSFEIFYADRDYAGAADVHVQAEGEIR